MYSWALNKIKLQRAIASAGAHATEAQVKEEYLKIGGVVEAEDVEEIKEVEPVVEKKPKKAVKKVIKGKKK